MIEDSLDASPRVSKRIPRREDPQFQGRDTDQDEGVRQSICMGFENFVVRAVIGPSAIRPQRCRIFHITLKFSPTDLTYLPPADIGIEQSVLGLAAMGLMANQWDIDDVEHLRIAIVRVAPIVFGKSPVLVGHRSDPWAGTGFQHFTPGHTAAVSLSGACEAKHALDDSHGHPFLRVRKSLCGAASHPHGCFSFTPNLRVSTTKIIGRSTPCARVIRQGKVDEDFLIIYPPILYDIRRFNRSTSSSAIEGSAPKESYTGLLTCQTSISRINKYFLGCLPFYFMVSHGKSKPNGLLPAYSLSSNMQFM